ncbi:hypothetical protein [Candidatus Uabimicrobium amorphum]|uniref:Uncharacterized protein n=1 Tax=Uabimicrobium amorphum TaxID=2596890 RepID=A0A5S9IRZ6_UABAM|nr:hypothetical protein [Candidatus Uabimicrobium amorphum]BBM86362.1 hypothetical protein UABAM_04748 [Candidatus Uabimicrobium amorphum]
MTFEPSPMEKTLLRSMVVIGILGACCAFIYFGFITERSSILKTGCLVMATVYLLILPKMVTATFCFDDTLKIFILVGCGYMTFIGCDVISRNDSVWDLARLLKTKFVYDNKYGGVVFICLGIVLFLSGLKKLLIGVRDFENGENN